VPVPADPPAKVKPRLGGISTSGPSTSRSRSASCSDWSPTRDRGRVAAAILAGSVVAMFGASALYHRFDWAPAARRRLRRLDHVGIYGLIAGTYTPFGLLVLSGAWRITVLGIVWAGALCAIMLKVFWGDAPRWLAAAIAVALGWVGVAVRRRRVLRAADV